MKERKVVITGIGVISSLGTGKAEFWKSVTSASSGIKKITRFNVEDLPSQKGSVIENINAKDFFRADDIRRVDRFTLLGMVAAKLAIDDCGIDIGKVDAERKGSIIKTIWGPFKSTEDYYKTLIHQGPQQVSPIIFSSTVANSPGGHISKHFQLKGVSSTLSGGSELGYAYQLIQNNKADMILVGGIEELNETVFKSFSHLGIIAKSTQNVPEDSRPFDMQRSGYVLGEGSAFLILEELEHALSHDPHIYAEIAGVSTIWDQFNRRTAADLRNNADIHIAKAMETAISKSNTRKESMDFICAMANSSEIADSIEALAIKRVFNERVLKIPVTALKSMIGETFGVSSALNIAYCILALKNNLIPPVINYTIPEPGYEFINVNKTLTQKDMKIALANSFEAIGGNFTSIVFKKYSNYSAV